MKESHKHDIYLFIYFYYILGLGIAIVKNECIKTLSDLSKLKDRVIRLAITFIGPKGTSFSWFSYLNKSQHLYFFCDFLEVDHAPHEHLGQTRARHLYDLFLSYEGIGPSN